MNLLLDQWIEVERHSGQRERIAPVQLTANSNDPVVELLAPRADFRGALYQFLIGLLQTVYAPQDIGEWTTRWNTPPDEAELQKILAPYAASFELDSTGPAFMQDFDLPPTEPIGIAGLLIETPGEKTISDNNDHFVHRGGAQKICPACAAVALLTLQINAPEGGRGNNVSVRGGGPLTTLRLPQDTRSSLWHKLWSNVFPDDVQIPVLSDVFPWMAATRTSGPNGVGDTTPETVHPLQAYWSTPRRIRLDFVNVTVGACELCGVQDERLVRQYRARPNGAHYTGAWMHPLTPYSHDPNAEKVPWSSKGQKGGIGYRHWLGLTLGKDDKQPAAAEVVAHFNRFAHRLPEDAKDTRLWCFGYDMSSAKARCWYDCTLPLHTVAPELQRHLIRAVEELLDVASDAASLLHKQVKAAWFKRPADVGNEPAVQLGFWQSSETKFYELLNKIVNADLQDDSVLVPFYREWLIYVSNLALQQFDDWVLAVPVEEMNMERVVKARAGLAKWLNNGKSAKELWELVNEMREVRA
jgi:CRISPR system Cascade subunit CasA